MKARSVDSKITQLALHITVVCLGIGFYMLLPLLNPYLYNEKMFTAVLVGYLASAREISSNISMVFGGPLGNVIGCKTTMVLGALIRVVAFVLFGIADDFALFVLGGMLIGLGGALFLPASNAYYDAISTDENRTKMFSIYTMLDTMGNVIGPALGSILVAVSNFTVMCFVSAGVYGVAIVLSILFLPNIRNEEARKAGVVGNIKECAQNKAFVKFLLFTSFITVIVLQRDLTIPVKLSGINPDYSVGFMYTIASLIGVVLQIPMVNFFKKRFDNYKIFGIASMMYTFGISMLGFAANIPMLYAGTIVYGIAQALYFPVKSAQVAEFAGPGKVAGYYGFQGLVGVAVSFLANLLGGYLYDFGATQTGFMSFIPWYVFIGIGVCIVVMFMMLSKKQKAKEQ